MYKLLMIALVTTVGCDADTGKGLPNHGSGYTTPIVGWTPITTSLVPGGGGGGDPVVNDPAITPEPEDMAREHEQQADMTVPPDPAPADLATPPDDPECTCDQPAHGLGVGHCHDGIVHPAQGHGNGHCKYDC